MNIDLTPTLAAWTGRAPPAVQLDGRDVSAVLTRKGAPSPHAELLFFNNEDVAGIRVGRWKYVTRSYYRDGELPLDAYDFEGHAHLAQVLDTPIATARKVFCDPVFHEEGFRRPGCLVP